MPHVLVLMKQKTQTKLISTEDQENRRQFDTFSALVHKQRLDKVEKILAIPSPSEGFRDWLIKLLWRLDRESQRSVRAKSSRAALKMELRKSAKLAEKLRLSAEIIWKAGEPSVGVLAELRQLSTLDFIGIDAPLGRGVDSRAR